MWIHAALALSAIALIGTGCSLATEDDGADDAAPGECGEVVLVTHDSFDLPKKVVEGLRGGVRLLADPQPGRRRRRAHQQADRHPG